MIRKVTKLTAQADIDFFIHITLKSSALLKIRTQFRSVSKADRQRSRKVECSLTEDQRGPLSQEIGIKSNDKEETANCEWIVSSPA
jgi:hypothetical protein